MTEATVKANWTKSINNAKNGNLTEYGKKALAWLLNQNNDFCQANKKYTGLQMLVRMQTVGLVDGWKE